MLKKLSLSVALVSNIMYTSECSDNQHTITSQSQKNQIVKIKHEDHIKFIEQGFSLRTIELQSENKKNETFSTPLLHFQIHSSTEAINHAMTILATRYLEEEKQKTSFIAPSKETILTCAIGYLLNIRFQQPGATALTPEETITTVINMLRKIDTQKNEKNIIPSATASSQE